MQTETATEKFIDIPVDQLHDSPNNPRGATDDDGMDGLVASVRSNGIIQPLIVRPLASGYEIAAGHRRKRAAIRAELLQVPCIIRTLTDDQMIDTHIVENIQRLGLSAIAEARTYKLMRDRGATIAQIAERSGKSEGYVTRRMSLTNLIPTLQADLDGELPLEYGFELAKYPVDAQEAAEHYIYGDKFMLDGVDVTNGYEVFGCNVEECFKQTVLAAEDAEDLEEPPACKHCGGITESLEGQEFEIEETLDRSSVTQSLANLRRWFTNQFLVDLSRAAFTKEDTRLRPDGLACVACPQRTGANAGLFGESETDYCLNRECFKLKTAAIVQITRTEKSAEVGEELPIAVENYGFVTELALENTVSDFRAYRDHDTERCEFTIQAFVANGMAVQEGCLVSSGCTVHHYQNRQVGASAVGISAEEAAAQKAAEGRRRKEEIWNVKVGEAVRRKVLVVCAKQYSEWAFRDALKMGLGPSVIAQIVPATINRMWSTEEFSHRSKVIIPALEQLFDGPMPMFERTYGMAEDAQIVDRVDYVEGLSFEGQSMALFLFTHGAKGAMFGGVWVDQDGIKQLAKDFDVNYPLIDAQTRVELSTKKFEKNHKAYLQQIETNDPQAVLPVLYNVEPVAKPEKVEKPKKTSKKAEETPIPQPDGVPEPVSEETLPIEPPATENESTEPEYAREEFERDQLGQTGEDNAAKLKEIADASDGQIMFVNVAPPTEPDTIDETTCASCGAETDGREVCEMCEEEGVLPEDGGDSDEEADELSDLFDAELAAGLEKAE